MRLWAVLAKTWHALVQMITGEWMLRLGGRRPNGGSMVIARALWSSGWIYLVLLGGKELLDPAKSSTFSLHELRLLILSTATWFGGLFTAAYASLYSRFSSQWTYLANLYNQIRAAELRLDPDRRTSDEGLLHWKAGFIEDADDLHLSSKPLFASVILAWCKDDAVKAAFAEAAVGGEGRLNDILGSASRYYRQHTKDLPPVS